MPDCGRSPTVTFDTQRTFNPNFRRGCYSALCSAPHKADEPTLVAILVNVFNESGSALFELQVLGNENSVPKRNFPRTQLSIAHAKENASVILRPV